MHHLRREIFSICQSLGVRRLLRYYLLRLLHAYYLSENHIDIYITVPENIPLAACSDTFHKF